MIQEEEESRDLQLWATKMPESRCSVKSILIGLFLTHNPQNIQSVGKWPLNTGMDLQPEYL